MHIEETLMRPNIYLSFIKDDELLKKYNKNCEKVKHIIKTNSIVNLHTMKNI